MTAAPSSYALRLKAGQFDVWQGTPPLLSRLDIELTERCNNNCIHCCINLPAGDARARRRELPLDRIHSILSEASALGALSIRLTGGEPLLRPDFSDIYMVARRLGLKVVLFTNARLVTPELGDLFARVPPLAPIEVTVYGLRRKSYEAVSRAPGSYEQFRRGVALLQERSIPLKLKGALLPSNRVEVQALDDWAMQVSGSNRVAAQSMFFDLRCRRDSEARNEEIKRLRASPEMGVALQARQRRDYMAERIQFCANYMQPSGDRLFDCNFGLRPCVDAYGALQGCMLSRHPDTVYDLNNGSIQEALLSFFPTVSAKLAANPDYLAGCARCFLKGLCEQCPAKSWMEHGTLDAPVEYLCRVAHVEARELGLLEDGEKAWEVRDWRERISALTADRKSQHKGDNYGTEEGGREKVGKAAADCASEKQTGREGPGWL